MRSRLPAARYGGGRGVEPTPQRRTLPPVAGTGRRPGGVPPEGFITDEAISQAEQDIYEANETIAEAEAKKEAAENVLLTAETTQAEHIQIEKNKETGCEIPTETDEE